MKILFVIGSFNAGGTETYLLRFLRQKSSSLPDCTVLVTCGNCSGALYEKYKELGIKIVPLRIGYRNILNYLTFYRFLKKNNYDTICDFDGTFSGGRIFTSYLAGVKKRIVFYRQTSDLAFIKFMGLSLNKIYKKLLFCYSTNILSNSKMAIDVYFDGLTDLRFKVIYNGIDTNMFNVPLSKTELRRLNNIPLNSFIIGHTGRFLEVKNHKFMIDVVAALKERNHNFHMVFAGRDVRENLISYANQKKVLDRVIFLGERNDIPSVLKMFDLYFFPSLSEGQPNALIEAFLSKLPFVASDIPCIREIVPEKMCDNLIDPRNVYEVVERIEHIITHGYDISAINELYEFSSNAFDAESRFNDFLNILK